jgi:hypothetical protein
MAATIKPLDNGSSLLDTVWELCHRLQVSQHT